MVFRDHPYFKTKVMSETKIYVRFIAPCKGFAYQVGAEAWVDKERIAPSIAMGKAVVIEEPVQKQIFPGKQAKYQTR